MTLTRNVLRKEYGLFPLVDALDVVIAPCDIDSERELCRYWVYYFSCCRNGISPYCFEEWKKNIDSSKTN